MKWWHSKLFQIDQLSKLQRCPRPPGRGVLGSTHVDPIIVTPGNTTPLRWDPRCYRAWPPDWPMPSRASRISWLALVEKKRSTKIIKRQSAVFWETKLSSSWWHQVDPSPVKFWILGVDWGPGFTFKQFRCTRNLVFQIPCVLRRSLKGSKVPNTSSQGTPGGFWKTTRD